MSSRTITLALIMTALIIALTPAYLVAIPMFLIFVILGFCLSSSIGGEDKTKLLTIFLFSYIIKVTMALIFYNIAIAKGLDGFFYGGDDYAFGNTGILLANSWREGIFPSFIKIKGTLSLSGTMGFYQYYLAALMFLSDNNTFLPIFLNCTFSSFSIFTIYALCKELFKNAEKKAGTIGLIAAGLLAFWPSLVFWATQNLKEAFTIFCVLLAAYAVTKGLNKFNKVSVVRYLILFILWVVLANLIRPGFSKFFVLAAVTGFFLFCIHRFVKKNIPIAFSALSCGLIIAFIALVILVAKYELIESMSTYIGTQRDLRAIGRSVIMPNIEIRSFFQMACFFPQALCIGLFYPLPWQGFSASSLFASFDMILWYVLFLFFLRGIVRTSKMESKGVYFILGFLIIYFLFLGFLDSNSGTLFRHRALAFPFIFIFISLGIISMDQISERCAAGALQKKTKKCN